MQGITEARWRDIIARHNFGIDEFHAPFVRVEHGIARRRDIRDLRPEVNCSQKPVPQVIFRNTDELQILIDSILDLGYLSVDLNLGCPFPLQTAKGRGAAAIIDATLMEQAATCIQKYCRVHTGLTFSAKIRLGMTSPEQWRVSADILNEMPLRHVTVHPRTASMKYSGTPLLDEFGYALDRLCHPVVYNGDITSPDDIAHIVGAFPHVAGIMIGRGMISRPTMVAEYIKGERLTPEQRIAVVKHVFNELQNVMERDLSGEAQILQKLKPYWEMCGDIVPRKIGKAIQKSRSLRAYTEAITII